MTKDKSYEFTLELLGPDVTDLEHFDTLSEATNDSALFVRRGDSQFADVDIEAPSFPTAVITAIQQLDGALPDLRVTRIHPEDLVNASEIARRSGRSRQSISQLVGGKRGAGDFPQPRAHANSDRPLWSWAEVAEWLGTDTGDAAAEEPLIAEYVAVLNGRLEAREHLRRLKAKVAERQAQRRTMQTKADGRKKPRAGKRSSRPVKQRKALARTQPDPQEIALDSYVDEDALSTV